MSASAAHEVPAPSSGDCRSAWHAFGIRTPTSCIESSGAVSVTAAKSVGHSVSTPLHVHTTPPPPSLRSQIGKEPGVSPPPPDPLIAPLRAVDATLRSSTTKEHAETHSGTSSSTVPAQLRKSLLEASVKVAEAQEIQRCGPAKCKGSGGGAPHSSQYRLKWKRNGRNTKSTEDSKLSDPMSDPTNGDGDTMNEEAKSGEGRATVTGIVAAPVTGEDAPSRKRGRRTTSTAKALARGEDRVERHGVAGSGSENKRRKKTKAVAAAPSTATAFRLDHPLPAGAADHVGVTAVVADVSYEQLLDARALFEDVRQVLDDPDRIQAPPLFTGFLTNVDDSTNFSISSSSAGKAMVPQGVHPAQSHRCVTHFAFRWKESMYVLSARVGFSFLLRVLHELPGVEVITFNAPALLLSLLCSSNGNLSTHCVSDVRVMCWMANVTGTEEENGCFADFGVVHRHCLPRANGQFAAKDALQLLVNQVHALAPLYRTLYGRLGSHGLLQAFLRQEKRISLLLAVMKWNGVTVDMDKVRRFQDACTAQMVAERDKAAALVPQLEEFNIQSHDQCREAIYEILGLGKLLLDGNTGGLTASAVSITKGGKLSTAEDTLQVLAKHHPFPAHIITYRKAAKLMQTYVHGIMSYALPAGSVTVGEPRGDGDAFVDVALGEVPSEAAPLSGGSVHCGASGSAVVSYRLHPNFLHEGTDTGRLSCAEPNLQSLPRSTFALTGSCDQGGEGDSESDGAATQEAVAFRKCFVAPEGCVLMSVDYGQIELRILAHLSADTALVDALTHSADIHRAIAELIFKKRPVSVEERNIAKRVVFGVLYGAGPRTLATHMQVSVERALHISSLLRTVFPQIDVYQRRTIEQARADGFVRTISGRVRYLPDINSSVMAKRTYAERQAFNSVIQGSAADVMKLAMLAVEREVLRESSATDVRLLMQIHDELVFSVSKEKLAELLPRLVRAMSRATSLLVPLTVTAKFGPSLGELQEWSVEHELVGMSSL